MTTTTKSEVNVYVEKWWKVDFSSIYSLPTGSLIFNKVHIAAAQVNFATREIDLSIIDQQLRKNFISIKILWAEDHLWLKI